MKKTGKKLIGTAGVLLFLALALLILNHTAQNGRKTTELLPDIVEEPVYVECEAGKPLEAELRAKEDFTAGGFQFLLVNLSEESSGTLRIAVLNSASELLMNEIIPVQTITPGKWFLVPADLYFTAGETYYISILADGSAPYFMQVPENGSENLPFTEKVFKDGKEAGCAISMGINVVEDVQVTYGQILYYSIPFCILAALFGLLCIWAGFGKVKEKLESIPFDRFFAKYGSDLFLLLIFTAVCISIYSRAYLKGVYISADSSGYLREAVNLVNGNGFGYDKMAGYTSWFANWPILYPAMIALVMVTTGANAYLASKLLAMLIAGLLLVLMRICFRKDAWVYALCLTNIGFLNLAYYTWSEIPFILFLTGFSLVLAHILGQDKPEKKWFVLLGTLGLSCFLTRYFGIYVWIVTGLYILYLFYLYWKEHEKKNLYKGIGLTLTAAASGIISIAYLMLNKLKNGMASGVSRTMWWDDYEKLTNDLVESLLTEFCNVFSLQIPELIEGFPYRIKVFVLILILTGLILLIRKNWRFFSREAVMITMAVSYVVIFVGIRYVSSMDTFYFRFFEPASFLFCMGMAGILLPRLKGRKGFCFFGGAVSVIVILSVWAVFENGGMEMQSSYYAELTAQWDRAYAEIPEKSVVIFSDIDFRSAYYRPDVVEGTISPADTLESIRETYYGSDYLCIRGEYVEAMLTSGEYEADVSRWLENGLQNMEDGKEFVILPLI